jgi:glycosyltransferase involved in cell wall biosynthesis
MRPKVLLLTQVLPYPPDSGSKFKTWNLIKWLSGDHDVTLVSFGRGEPPGAVDELRRYCREVFVSPMRRAIWRDLWALSRSLARRRPWVVLRDDRRAMHSLVRKISQTEPFDIVHIDQLNMFQYAASASGDHRVLDCHDVLWRLYRDLAPTLRIGPRSILYRRDARLLLSFEARACRSVDAVIAVSEADRTDLEQVCGPAVPVDVVPIAADCDEVRPIERKGSATAILHLGTMFWPPNVGGVRWFADEVLESVRRRCPAATLQVVGARPPGEIRALARRAGIEVSGYVRDPTPYLERAALMIVPLWVATGMRVKILTALLHGIPVVTTSVGCSGIDVQSGRDLLIADSVAEFADAVVLLLRDRELGDRLARNGRRLVEQRYDYRVVGPKVGEIYRRVLGGK